MVGRRLRCRWRCSVIRPRCGDVRQGPREPVSVGTGRRAEWSGARCRNAELGGLKAGAAVTSRAGA